ncbi:MAG TPA: redoxin family protein [Blastocatellia bacterium]|nr:redoxin family protein [Blastocatellia bacterium]HMV86554.1 redoxin family protein [Blastocatellia bacterium]HMX29042.1 redoxin family protein [Blastocatellia bacterium]HMZ21241.1 redoxin family protein [Blastocatellia bacterium]HNG31376.1 redoxin family protein [Blastocatellia bacterium]
MKSKLLLISLAVLLALCSAIQAQQKAGAQAAENKEQPAKQEASVDSDDELRRAIESSGGSETQIVVNLEGYLKKFPKSAHQAEIENEIFKLSNKLRDRGRTITYAEKILSAGENNIDVLTTLVTTLRERRADGDLKKALGYADQLVKQFESLIAAAAKPKRISAAQWEDRKQQGIASIYLLRGRVHADLGNDEPARADLMKSFEMSRTAGAAVSLAELAEKRKNTDEAIDYYSQSFVIALAADEEIDLKAVRRNLSRLYATKQNSETGLGDRVLKAYDAFIKQRDERLAKLEPPNSNTGLTDPLSFKLTKLDGSRLDLATLRGKVVVFNFWATWCGPCLTEMPLVEKTMNKYKDDAEVVFLAVSTDEDRELVPPHLKQYKVNLPVAYADSLNDFFTVTSIPTTIILDRKGELAFRMSGYNPREDFSVMLSEKIEAAKKR